MLLQLIDTLKVEGFLPLTIEIEGKKGDKWECY
jgi:hypothetical protein